jgi:hypothetical protein
MTEVTVRTPVSVESATADIRLSGKCLAQLLDLIAHRISDACPGVANVSVVVRDRGGVQHWGTDCGPHRLVALPRSPMGFAVDRALDAGHVTTEPDGLVIPIGSEDRIVGAVVVTHPTSPMSEFELARLRDDVQAWRDSIDNALAWSEAQARITNLEVAIARRAVIEQAKGMLMARHGCSADAAFEMLRRESQHGDVKISVLAARLVEAAVSR